MNPCRKNRYDKKGAVTVVNRARSRRGTLLRPYPCPKCQGWHVSSHHRDGEKLS